MMSLTSQDLRAILSLDEFMTEQLVHHIRASLKENKGVCHDVPWAVWASDLATTLSSWSLHLRTIRGRAGQGLCSSRSQEVCQAVSVLPGQGDTMPAWPELLCASANRSLEEEGGTLPFFPRYNEQCWHEENCPPASCRPGAGIALCLTC